jgi:hydrogenase expression/formation protein HypD
MDRSAVTQLVDQITEACAGRERVQLMEVCGTHTVSLFRTGVKSLLPGNLRLVSGPGCPVCVTSQGYLDAACELALQPDVTICTYGDMVRVPGSTGSLADCRARGAEVIVVTSTRDALRVARENSDRRVVFLAVGFETTTPPTAVAVLEAAGTGVDNFFILPAHKLVIPAMRALLSAGDVPIDGFMCPGHVSIIIGADAYAPIADEFGKPCVVAGFEPRQMLEGILRLVQQVAAGEARVENVYGAVVTDAGNVAARECVDKVFQPGAAVWRAIGEIPDSGLDLRPEFERFDALREFGIEFGPDVCPAGCLCGEVIQGKADPSECALFGEVCTPIKPVGPCMVSSEGTCAAWYKYGRKRNDQ